jgi:glycosyltransferase involved in cell wall biosynthesis
MKADGHDPHILANYGQIAGVTEWNGIPVWPQGVVQYGIDVLDDQADIIDPAVIFTLYDVWVLPDELWPQRRVISWTPVDHAPPPPGVLRWATKRETIAMSEFGAEQLRMTGIEPIATIPHAIEDVFRPTPSDARERMAIPDDGWVVMVNAANIGTTPPRKSWTTNLEAVAAMMRDRPDVYLYLHTDLYRPGGMPLQVLIKALAIDPKRIKVPPPVLYRGGLIDDTEMARIYSAVADNGVLLGTSKGEGFGVPTIEGLGTGLPSIVSDFSASPEIVADTGWLVPVQLDWDHNQASWFCTPSVAGTRDALEEAYAERGTEQAAQRRAACLERAELYRADRVYAERWRPLLAALEDDMKPRPHKSNAAKRRARKEAAA